jgi:hypothetical protein
LPTEIPGSFEEERSWTKVVFDDTHEILIPFFCQYSRFGLKTLDTNRGSFIRYTCTAFITEQKHLDTDQDNLMITVEVSLEL